MTNLERRSFIKGAAAVSAITILKPSTVFGTKANSAIQLGIIGCGNRGTSVISAMSKYTNVNIMAMADLFDDQLQVAKEKFDGLNQEKGFAKIDSRNIYQGSKAYLDLLNNKKVEAVLISSPAYTHPEFVEAAIAAGKHIYCEKPVAIDVEGVKRIERAGSSINGKLSMVVGFQIRHATAYQEMVKRVQEGAIGDLVTAQLYYLASGLPLKPIDNMSKSEAMIRNQFHFRALSGGILLDQGIHMLDVCSWALQKKPILAMGTGGRDHNNAFGDAWNNYQIIYKYPDNIRVSFHSTQLGPVFGDVCARFIGTKGIATAHYSGGVFIDGEQAWDSGVLRHESQGQDQNQQAAGVFTSALHDSNENKVKSFIGSIRSGNFLNESASGAASTYTAILGRMAAENGEQVSWESMQHSNESIDPNLNLPQFD
ncbi:Gfo/Idh/MocA family oxidoreductase [Cyclobacterium sp. 1_MG-2023]|uniref:Gfo/Idh/MocA family protein n=1 Tax=Cyclobacterium sp. 1_MG-2023 TaxID=3062681 RepID=UPI0026E2CB1D|nr:Gfo/Idh/MocA family oxidoreductase [Cyclobacterium sp. 1_MG-2023]MDO6436895.1 Gfo/Idh/MocA family oxidoreductase [Cyclobacterium sp. 1_MG-2023]